MQSVAYPGRFLGFDSWGKAREGVPIAEAGGRLAGPWDEAPLLQKLKYNITFIPLKNRLTTRFCHVLLCIVSAILKYCCKSHRYGL